ncbi:galactonate dehydratase [Serratia proteamaculans]|uniref:UxaA family hydrolase n=1 Tax=Serratia proteamaculans TaxID=28151 RepID=UPI001075FBE3|nr:UxaA family hydrolase [Serratia proteamaculans]TFZ50999.1 galactonate dehydratase [Serratia proteamaculans]
MNNEFKWFGYRRENGQVGSRNIVAIIPATVCVTEIAQAIVYNTQMSKALLHHCGCCQLMPDLNLVTETLGRLGSHPNVGAALVISLGCEGSNADEIVAQIASTGRPVEKIVMQELGGTSRAIQQGIDLVQKMAIAISAQQRSEAGLEDLVMGIKCGSSDTTSGLSSNMVIGQMSDRIVDACGTVLFGETTEFMGAEHILARRGRTPEVGQRIYKIVDAMEKRAMAVGVDMRNGQPTPGNIAGGLSTIEEKSLGAINKSGSRTIEGVLDYADVVPGKGLWIKDSPGFEPEILTGIAAGGAQGIVFSTGRGAPQGFPIVPVLKICGNPRTYQQLSHDMDIDAGQIILGNKSIEQVTEETLTVFMRVLSGELTKSEAINYNRTMDIHTYGPKI